ncbi:MAG TPA: C-type lectin domain-containing protein [Kofleriaceae bacterium]
MRALAALMLLAACSKFYGLDPPLLMSDAPRDDAGDFDDATERDARAIDASADAPTPPANCPPSYTLANGTSRYRLSTTTAEWPEAAQDCRDDSGPTGTTHLIVVINDAERMYLRTIVPGAVWVGLSDLLVEAQFRWNTAEPTNYPNNGGWGLGEPSGGVVDPDCVATISATTLLDDVVCSSTLAYVCECDSYPDDPSRYSP